MPALRRRSLNQTRDRPVQQKRKQKARRNCFAITHSQIGIRKPTHQELLSRSSPIGLEIRINRRQQCSQETALPQHFETAHAAAVQKQLERLIEEARRRHVSQSSAQSCER